MYEKYGKIEKVASDIIDFYICDEVNGNFAEVYFLSIFGNVYKLSGFSRTESGTLSGELKVTEISGITNIVKVLSIPINGINQTIFVDINGNLFNSDGSAIE